MRGAIPKELPSNNSGSIDLLQVRRANLTMQVVEQIQQFIVRGQLRPGDRLPPERELSEQLGVSRTVIREATKQLQERGLVKVLTGSGTYVSRIEPAALSQSISLFMWGHGHAFHDLLECRKMFEVEIAGLAAERATDDDLQRLEGALAQMTAGLPEVHASPAGLERFVQADLLFHQVLAAAGKNSLLPLLLAPISDLCLEFSRQASSLEPAPQNAIRFHQLLVDGVRSHDSARCRAVMRDHLTDAENLIDQLTIQQTGPAPR